MPSIKLFKKEVWDFSARVRLPLRLSHRVLREWEAHMCEKLLIASVVGGKNLKDFLWCCGKSLAWCIAPLFADCFDNSSRSVARSVRDLITYDYDDNLTHASTWAYFLICRSVYHTYFFHGALNVKCFNTQSTWSGLTGCEKVSCRDLSLLLQLFHHVSSPTTSLTLLGPCCRRQTGVKWIAN